MGFEGVDWDWVGKGDWDKGDGWLGALWNGSDAPGPATHKTKVKEDL